MAPSFVHWSHHFPPLFVICHLRAWHAQWHCQPGPCLFWVVDFDVSEWMQWEDKGFIIDNNDSGVTLFAQVTFETKASYLKSPCLIHNLKTCENPLSPVFKKILTWLTPPSCIKIPQILHLDIVESPLQVYQHSSVLWLIAHPSGRSLKKL